MYTNSFQGDTDDLEHLEGESGRGVHWLLQSLGRITANQQIPAID